MKRVYFVSNCNSVISWAFFMLFIPVETGVNALLSIYLMDWWRHNMHHTAHHKNFSSCRVSSSILLTLLLKK